ncbi:ferredoxin [Mycobacterium sp. CBMA 234]|uniref:ferredoxin n=1 Tax=Mycolicibacterium sp. CBMA 234 TaxID=1918495 RepID=UPI0012DDC8E3|nr:ferredoxin [Mycolicibacterium sp. CBMA 234]MUL66417.1 ferredoxin [Mycolicibacterium sp. CBMA 234]
MRVTVDDDACGGHGVCVGLCPEVFALGDGGYAHAVATDIRAEFEGLVAEAVSQCPERAIHVH